MLQCFLREGGCWESHRKLHANLHLMCFCACTPTHTACTPVVAKATSSLPLHTSIRQGKSEIWTTAVFLRLSPPPSQPMAQIPPFIPLSPWGRWNLKWRFNEISGIVLWLDHSGSPLHGGMVHPPHPISAVCWSEGAQLLIAGPQDKQGNGKKGGGRMKREIRTKTQKGITAHVSKGHMWHTEACSYTHMYAVHVPLQSMVLPTTSPLWCWLLKWIFN